MNMKKNKNNVGILEELIIREIKTIPEGPLSFFLSGGLDSSLILALLRKVYPNIEINTYSYAKQIDHPDLVASREMSLLFNTNHTELLLTEELLSKYVEEFNEIKKYDFEGDVYCYILCKQVLSNKDKIVTGDGGDECFGGYFLHECPLGHRENGIISSYEGISSFTKEHIEDMISVGFRDFLFKDKSTEEDYNKVWEYYITTLIPQQVNPLLYLESIMGVKFYLPLVSDKIIEFMRSLPYIERVGKKLERELAAKYLPEHIINRKKFNLKGYSAR